MNIPRVSSGPFARLAVCGGTLLVSACSYKPSCSDGSAPLGVPARPDNLEEDILSPTQVRVNAGDRITVEVRPWLKIGGYGLLHGWNVGFGEVGPWGHPGQGNDGCPAADAPIGSLIGRLGPHEENERGDELGKYFPVGSKNTYTADKSEMLYLGSNDNAKGTCGWGKHSCYRDNKGFLDVCVTIMK
jgi:hypothetical protein